MAERALRTEILLVVVVLLTAVVAPRLGCSWFRAAERALGRLARRRKLSILLVGILPLVLRAALLPFFPIPEPAIHDEFSYLLAADTFASGRLTNPPHPLWKHFESFHIIQQPTYMSMYPPAQGMALAAGKVLFGHPWAGVFLSVGVMAGAILWMLQGWLPPEWALLGAVLAVLRAGILSGSMNDYAGGAVAALGGALLLGALPRLRRKERIRDALLLALGVAILANSRPYEGMVLSLTVAAALPAWRLLRRRVVLPILLVLALTAGGMGYYFWRVTGSPFRMPFQVNRDTYAVASVLVWRAPRPVPTYRHPVMRDFYVDWELPALLYARRPANLPTFLLYKVTTLDLFYLGPALTLPLLTSLYVLRDRRTRFLVIAAAVFLVGLALEVWIAPHYASPLTAAIYGIVAQAMRHLRLCRWPRQAGAPGSSRREGAGLFMVRAIPLICSFTLTMCAVFPHGHISESCKGREIFRSPVMTWLNKQSGRHLLLVRYKPNHDPLREWVYNEADIDRARIVWAREMDASSNRRLLQYFKDRRAWLLEPDEVPTTLSEYPRQENAGSSWKGPDR